MLYMFCNHWWKYNQCLVLPVTILAICLSVRPSGHPSVCPSFNPAIQPCFHSAITIRLMLNSYRNVAAMRTVSSPFGRIVSASLLKLMKLYYRLLSASWQDLFGGDLNVTALGLIMSLSSFLLLCSYSVFDYCLSVCFLVNCR